MVYYGSTCRPLSARKASHQSSYRSYLKGNYNFNTSFTLLKNNAVVDIILVETCKCKNKEELHATERSYIEGNVCINKIIPTRTKQEYYQENKEKYLKKYESDRETILEQRKEKVYCECGSTYTKRCKLRHERTSKHRYYINK